MTTWGRASCEREKSEADARIAIDDLLRQAGWDPADKSRVSTEPAPKGESPTGDVKMKSREEALTENFHAWVVAKSVPPKQAQYLSLLKNRSIVHGKIEVQDLFRPPLLMLNAAETGVELFGERNLREIIEDLNESVFKQIG